MHFIEFFNYLLLYNLINLWALCGSKNWRYNLLLSNIVENLEEHEGHEDINFN